MYFANVTCPLSLPEKHSFHSLSFCLSTDVFHFQFNLQYEFYGICITPSTAAPVGVQSLVLFTMIVRAVCMCMHVHIYCSVCLMMYCFILKLSWFWNSYHVTFFSVNYFAYEWVCNAAENCIKTKNSWKKVNAINGKLNCSQMKHYWNGHCWHTILFLRRKKNTEKFIASETFLYFKNSK